MSNNVQGSPPLGRRASHQGGTQIGPMRNANPQPNFNRISVGTRVVGIVRDGEFIKHLKASIHFLHTPCLAIACDVSSLHDAIRHDAISVMVIDTESGKVYRAFISTIWDKGFEVNRGWGEQIALALVHWSQGDEPLGEQLRMWE